MTTTIKITVAENGYLVEEQFRNPSGFLDNKNSVFSSADELMKFIGDKVYKNE